MKTKALNAKPTACKGVQHFLLLPLRGNKTGLLCLLLLLSAGAIAGNGDKQDNLNWQLDATVKGVQFYHAISDCNGRQVTFLKFINKNSYAVNASWKESVKTQLRTEDNLFRGAQQLSLPPGETLADNCSAACKACMLTNEGIDPTYVAQVASFTFKNISVEK